jgi:replicative DNA helicase
MAMRKKQPTAPPTAEQVPRDVDAERLLLREVLVHGASDLAAARAIVTVEDFFDPRHAVIFAALLELADAGAPVEIGALQSHLDRSGKLLGVGGPAFLGSLIG